MHPLQKTARIAGLLYLLVVIIGPIVLLYIPGKLFVPGDPTATAHNMLANEPLVRTHIVLSVLAQLLFISAVFAFFQLLKGVNKTLAALMVILILIDSPLAFLSITNEAIALTLLRTPDLAAFDQAQRNALAMLYLDLNKVGVYVSSIFWGLWLLPLGWLVRRSGFLPRWLGVWLIVNGLAYIVLSFIGLLAPQYHDTASTYAIPILFGEVALMLWLLIFGARSRPTAVPAAA